MYRWTERNGYISAKLSGPDMQAEITRHFRLTHLVAVDPNATIELRQQVIRGLRATARLLSTVVTAGTSKVARTRHRSLARLVLTATLLTMASCRECRRGFGPKVGRTHSDLCPVS
jgi:hypothetical protein